MYKAMFYKSNSPLSVLMFAAVLLSFGVPATQAKWKPVKGPLMTQWAKEVSPGKVHPEYPRPQIVRKQWLNLNGLWEYAIRPKDEPKPATFDGQILVPFPIESALSGVMKSVGEEKRLWYRRTFDIPRKWMSQRILLHFGGVDWETAVWVNGKKVGTHKGGYDAFTFDITDVLNAAGSQEVVLEQSGAFLTNAALAYVLEGRPEDIVYCNYCNYCADVNDLFLNTTCAFWPKGSTQAPDPFLPKKKK